MRSTNPTLEINHSSPVPLHEQVAATIRRAIVDGKARPGERLPPARDLAAVLGGTPTRPEELAEIIEQVSWESP